VDTYTFMDAAMRGVMFLLFAFLLILCIRVLRWLWRRVMGLSVSGVASTTGVVAGRADSLVRQFARGFRQGYKEGRD